MWEHINANNILHVNQHGFRSGLNTTTQLLHVIHFASEALDKKQPYHIVSFDFKKAFDRVPHSLLIHKLKKYRFSKQCIQWIQQWLSDRKSVVFANGTSSKCFAIGSGVPQGSVLGPLLFNLHINDIVEEVQHSDCRLYADDTLLCANLTRCNASELQSDVTRLHDWSVRWAMEFNPRKCIHMQIGSEQPDISLQLGASQIPHDNTVKYLGLHISSNLKWKVHITKITAKANRSLGMIKRCLRFAPAKTKTTAFNTIVRPILEYATQAWSPHNIGLDKTVDKVQRNAVRWIHHLHKFDSVTDCMHAHDICSLSDRRKTLDLQFLRKIEAGLYEIKLNHYIRFTSFRDTRGKTISWQHNTNQWRYSYYNRMKTEVKVYFNSP
jgi:hypothetical protein